MKIRYLIIPVIWSRISEVRLDRYRKRCEFRGYVKDRRYKKKYKLVTIFTMPITTMKFLVKESYKK